MAAWRYEIFLLVRNFASSRGHVISSIYLYFCLFAVDKATNAFRIFYDFGLRSSMRIPTRYSGQGYYRLSSELSPQVFFF